MTYKIKNWNKFQHFKDRRPPWIKLYRDLLDDREWFELDPLSSKHLVNFWLLASENDGELPSINDLAFRLRLKNHVVIEILMTLSHWIEQTDITLISPQYQSDPLEREREREKEKEKEKEKKIKASPLAPKVAIPIDVSESTWNDFLILRKSKKASLTLTALKGIVREADKAKKSLEEVLQICCERGWAGFKAEWILESSSSNGAKPTQAWRTNDSLMMAKASELGLHTIGLQRFEIINKIDATMRSRGL